MPVVYKGVGGSPSFDPKGGGVASRIPYSSTVSCYFVGVNNLLALPNEPESIVYDYAPPHTAEYSIDGKPIIRIGKHTPVTVVLSGRTGTAPRDVVTRSGRVFLDPRDTITHFVQNLENMVHSGKYSSYLDQRRGVNFIDLINGRSMEDIQVTGFNIEQDASSTRKGYLWQVEFVSYLGNDTYLKKPSSAWANLINNVTRAVDAAALFLGELEATIDGARDYAIAPIKKALTSVRRTSKAFRDLVASGGYTIAQLRIVVDDLAAAVTDVIHSVAVSVVSIKRVWDNSVVALFTADYWTNIWADWADASQLGDDNEGTPRSEDLTLPEVGQLLEQTNYELAVLRGYLGFRRTQRRSLPSGTGGSFLDKDDAFRTLAQYSDTTISTTDIELEDNYVPYNLRSGDNLFTVAARLFGTASLWSTLAEINHWQDAYTLPNGEPARAGVAILVPNEIEGRPAQFLNYLSDPSDLLLTDMMLDEEGDLIITNNFKDVALISGGNNYVQALTNRLRTTQGELPFEQNYGLDAPIGNISTNRSREALTLEIIDQLSREQRTSQVRDVIVNVEGDTSHVELIVVPISGTSVNMILPL